MFAESSAFEQIGRFVPCARLYTEPILVETAKGNKPVYRELTMPVLSVTFDYDGTVFRPGDERTHFFSSEAAGVRSIARDLRGEAAAQQLLEGFGAVELACLDDCEAPFDSEADYVVQVEGNVHSYCSFTAYAVARLREHGWRVSIDEDYPFQVVEHAAPLYAELSSGDGDDGGWFNLELGVEIDGRHVNLLPALVDLIDSAGDAGSLKQLLRLPARYRAIPVGENRYLTFPPERLERLLEVVLELYRGDRLIDGTLLLGRMQAGSLERLDELVQGTGRDQVCPARPSLRERLPASTPPPAAIPNGLCAELRPYQREGLAWLEQLRGLEAGGVLADDMGLGKTLQTIAHLVAEKEAGRLDRPALVVMPTSLVNNWRSELRRFAPSLSVAVWHGSRRHSIRNQLGAADVVLTTYPLLVRDARVLGELAYYLVILDEAQAIKNPKSLAKRAVQELVTERRLCLTGTPIENNLDELWSLFDFLIPGLLGEVDGFRSRFRDPIERDGSNAELSALRRRIEPFVLRRMKEHVARELPPKTELVRAVELSGEQRDLYESIRVAVHGDVRRAIRSKGFSASTITILDGLMKLRQACCDPRLLSVPAARKVTQSAKYEFFFELLGQQLASGRHVLVFSQFTRMLALLARGLGERKIRYAVLTGATVDRARPISSFQAGEVPVFLISLKAGGTGLNLTRADTVIHYDPWWNAAAQSQATDRAHRIGQTRPVFVHNLIVAGSVEERMLRLQQRKRELANALLGAAPTGAGAPLTYGEVEDLFSPLTDG